MMWNNTGSEKITVAKPLTLGAEGGPVTIGN